MAAHVPPTWLPGPRLEVSVHTCPPRALADVRAVFPTLPRTAHVLILPVFQPTRHDMVETGGDVDRERDALLENVRAGGRPGGLGGRAGWERMRRRADGARTGERGARAQFAEWAQDFCRRAAAEGHWADFTDPCSGYPVRIPPPASLPPPTLALARAHPCCVWS